MLLVVDDAVDSGKTLSEVVTRLKSMYPHARVVTAAVAVTTPDPNPARRISLYADTLVKISAGRPTTKHQPGGSRLTPRHLWPDSYATYYASPSTGNP